MPPETQFYRLSLESGEAVVLEVEQLDFDLEVRILTPQGQPQLTFDGPYGTGVAERVCFTAQLAGVYGVEIAAFGRTGGDYVIQWLRRRPATKQDRACQEAAEVFMASERSRLSGNLNEHLSADYQRAHELWRKADEPFLAGMSLRQAGIVRRQLGYSREASGLYLDAMRWATDARNAYLEISLLTDLGQAAGDRGELPEARDYFQRALARARDSGERRLASSAFSNLAWIAKKRGETHRAIEYLQDALDLWDEHDEDQELAQIRINLANAYTLLDRYPEALAIMNQVLGNIRLGDDPRREASALTSIGWLHHLMEERSTAVRFLERALALQQSIGNASGQVGVLDRLGTVFRSQGRLMDALGAYQRALSFARPMDNAWSATSIQVNLGCLFHQLERPEDARRYLVEARKALNRIEDPKSLSRLELCLALIERKEGNLDAALAHISAARSKVEDLQRRARERGERHEPVWLWQDFAELHLNLLMEKAQATGNRELEREALELFDRARSRVLHELLLEGRGALRQKSKGELQELKSTIQQQLNATAARRRKLDDLRSAAEEIGKNESSIDRLFSKLNRVQAVIRAKDRPNTRDLAPRAITVGRLQQLLEPEVLLLRYALTENSGYIFAVGKDSWKVWPIDGRSRLDAQVKTFYEGLRQCQVDSLQSELAASFLGRQLLPAEPIPSTVRRILIVADGFLHYLPFAVLASPWGTGSQGAQRLLIDDFEIHYLPSAAMLEVLSEGNEDTSVPGSAAVFADAVFSREDARFGADHSMPCGSTNRSISPDRSPGGPLPRLPCTRQEAISLLKWIDPRKQLAVFDFAASKQRVLSTDLAEYRVLHFATHAIIDERYPDLSGLVLSMVDSEGQSVDGELHLHEIYDLELAADLVTLSGCQTALGRHVRGNGLLSMTRGFLYAGGSRVLVSLWSVDDDATAVLMDQFYSAFLGRGESPSQALRSAQLWMRRHERWRSPFFWAPWILQGNP